MKAIREFHTGLVPIEKDIDPRPPYNGRGWSARIRKRRMKVSGRKENEVAIYAKSWVTAQQALDLIISSLSLFVGGAPTLPLGDLIAHNEDEPIVRSTFEKERIFSQYWSTVDIPVSCAMAAKASRCRKFGYAIAKYALSVSLYSVDPVDLEPYGSAHLSVSAFYREHVAFSHSIIAAYSAVEELGFNVPASRENPSTIQGNWNPVVRMKLEDRLGNAGIELEDKLLWTMRGPRRRIDSKKAPRVSGKAPWSHGLIRDADIDIVDAINYASWLRSNVASHKVSDLGSSLSPYDVINVQHLARRLILESLGFWQ